MRKVKMGFDIGSSNLAIVHLDGDAVKTDVVRIPSGIVDEDGYVKQKDSFIKFLKNTKKSLKLKRCSAALALPNGHTSCKLTVLPEMTESQVMINIPHEFVDFLEAPAAEYKFDYALCQADPKSGEDPDDSRLAMMVACARKDELNDYYVMFKRAGFKLTRMIPQDMAVVRLSDLAGVGECCIVDLGYRWVRASMCWNGRIRASRQIPTGVKALETALSESDGSSQYVAGSYLRSDELDDSELLPIYNEVAVEILKTVNFYQFTYKSQLDGIYLIGGGALVGKFRDVIQSVTGMEVLDISKLFGGSEEDAVMGFMARGAMLIGGDWNENKEEQRQEAE